MEIQCNLYDAKTGELRQSDNYPFTTNRFYSAQSGGRNNHGTGDLYLGAAKAIADSTTFWLVNILDPMVILKREDKTVFINRGLGAHMRVGEVYRVYGDGTEILDQKNHPSGPGEVLKGKVYISELHEKFSEATIIGPDNGISKGNKLRLQIN